MPCYTGDTIKMVFFVINCFCMLQYFKTGLKIEFQQERWTFKIWSSVLSDYPLCFSITLGMIDWMVFKVISTHFRLFNDFSSFIGGGRPQNNSDWVEPPFLRK
jgi:hypothetical protein